MNKLLSPNEIRAVHFDNTNGTDYTNMPNAVPVMSKTPKLMKVLLVEDSALLRETLIEILSGCPGLSFEGTASTQSGAIALLQQKPFDMMLVDIELAQGNGFEVIKATCLDTYPFAKPICIILTNHAHNEYRVRAKMLGAEYFFDKSMDFEQAIETIEAESKKFANASH